MSFCGNVFVYRFLILLIQYLYLNSKSKYGILQRGATIERSIRTRLNYIFSGESFGDITCMNNVPNETLERITVEPIKKGILPRRVFKLILARLRSQPIKYRVRHR